MLFLGAFIVNAAIMHVDLHKRIALKCLLSICNTPVRVPERVLFLVNVVQ